MERISEERQTACFTVVATKDIKPNQVVSIGNSQFRVRYITRHGNNTTLLMQRKNDPLSPFMQNDVIWLTVNNQLDILLAVDVQATEVNTDAE
ncbi:hypothetical protein [Yersinia enterocolitica]|uniref:hypothetical protein n=1 Tax=Yersinia enterocolitica TaxID=630 RepID=UPI0029BB3779|nr:hypothetical protein [Yersinia enterocolitica]EKN6253628.1 hypothetical protein [Yersinia enterocolitica]HDL6896757.1 hypothetical protein [Yersinia enterocolitica]HDL7024616.1 hypothetical protein [Yersinia enterocolitica]HDL7364860.1 hypothetical protein [Yersinia enterocolitica]